MKLLITGGAGYIGSHTCVEALRQNYEVIIIDNFYNSDKNVISRIEELSQKKVKLYDFDINDKNALISCLNSENPSAVIHFAGLKAVGESEENPMLYYDNNVKGTITLLDAMKTVGIKNFLFSSSATVYGNPHFLPYTENHPLSALNIYGQTKLMVEDMCRGIFRCDKSWNIALLRYFNPIGAHPSGSIGEDPNGIPNNLLPYIAQVAVGKREKLRIFGSDYKTHDGTGIRDYIHVMDLAEGHLKALEKINSNPGLVTYNLGTGHGYSVFDVLHSFEKACGKKIPYEVVERRPGDLPAYWADAKLAGTDLGWQATRTLDEMTADTWRWQKDNPNGFRL